MASNTNIGASQKKPGGSAGTNIGASQKVTSISATITGTATASIDEADVVAGAKTIIITMTGDTWVAHG